MVSICDQVVAAFVAAGRPARNRTGTTGRDIERIVDPVEAIGRIGTCSRGSALIDRLKRWAIALKTNVIALWLAARDPRTPFLAKLTAAAVAAYALSPIDLIPDFLPVIGYLDDLLIVPAGIALAINLIPADLMKALRDEAARLHARPRTHAGAIAVVAVWIAAAAIAVWLLWTEISGRLPG